VSGKVQFEGKERKQASKHKGNAEVTRTMELRISAQIGFS
jgi:hypothetical protein